MEVNAPKFLLEGQETDCLIFRRLEESDFDLWLPFFEHPDSMKYMLKSAHTDAAEQCREWIGRAFIRINNGLGGLNVLIDKTSGAFIGMCGLLIQNVDDIQEMEIGYSLLPDQRYKGYASEAAIKCRDFAFENNYTDSIISIIHVDNTKSANVARKNGMTLDKTTIFKDCQVNIFRIDRADWERKKGARA